ncbi:MAG TPA: VOC family protein, partial [Acidimicrobiales bacterium]|nr:VOC family protein [Acidimicrobiales bacterium]
PRAGPCNAGAMGINHLAFASRDIKATHRFYTEVMGFRLVKTIAAPTPEGGWARHVFFDTGEGALQSIAFWDLHVPGIDEVKTDLSKSVGLPGWVNHIAFDSRTLEHMEQMRERWREHGCYVAHVDHGFCQSIYTTDPNGITVEFCCTLRDFDDTDVAEAEALLSADEPPLSEAPEATFFPPVARV